MMDKPKTDELEKVVARALATADGDFYWKSADFTERRLKEDFYRRVARHQIAAFTAIHTYLDEQFDKPIDEREEELDS